MLDLSASSRFKEGALALVSLTAIRTDADALFNGISAFYAKCKLFIIQLLVTIVQITNLIRINEIPASN